MFESTFASHEPAPGAINLTNAPIIIDEDDYKGVKIAAMTVSADLARVTDRPLIPVTLQRDAKSVYVIIAGSIERSSVIKSLADEGKLDIGNVKGQWECYGTQIVNEPCGGCKKALVIYGSDKRGAIFGLYSFSEQIGVSPWHWWADVPVKKSDDVYALDVQTRNGPPSIKYRGIFINDEAPALSAWVHEKFGPKYNSEFYKKVFELLLRLKANFLWPAMWFGFPHPGNSFFMDDPFNQELADRYGIVVSTSHHEPMQRAMNEWFSEPYNEPEKSWSWIKNKGKITKYFQEGAQRATKYESYITMGMRGDGDREMDVENPQEVLKEILQTQRSIIKDSYGKKDGVPQLIALYKEVQEYYENGLEIRDDVTLLFADDNFGTIRRLPTEKEKQRPGGSGIYYHLEYVGEPRSYKWLNSNSLAKIWQQLDRAYHRGADQIWVFNIGDIKPLEIPLSFVMSLAWNVHALDVGQLPKFLYNFFEKTVGVEHASTCADLLVLYDKLLALRKHEHIEANTFSIVNYDEADAIVQSWRDLRIKAEDLYTEVGEKMKPSVFQLLLHPIKASYIYNALRVAQAKNRLFAEQRRSSANSYFNECIAFFKEDFALSQEYHALLNGKWNHIMRQPHYGYRDTWHAPSRDMISGLCYVQAGQDSNPIAGNIGIAVDGHPGVRPGLCNEESDRTHPSGRDLVAGLTLPPMEPFGPPTRWFDIYSRSSRALTWTAKCPHEWLKVEPSRGVIDPQNESRDEDRIDVSVDWKLVPETFHDEVLIVVESNLGDLEHVHVPVINRTIPQDCKGHVESDGHLSIPASRFIAPASGAFVHHYIGRQASGGVSFRGNETTSCVLRYPFYTFTSATKATLSFYITLTLDTDPDKPLSYVCSVDDKARETYRFISEPRKPGELPPGWLESVMDCVWIRKHEIDLSVPGEHSLEISLNDENVVLEKIVIDLGGLRESYLGPPASFWVGRNKSLRRKSVY